jgi:hypothetical protein
MAAKVFISCGQREGPERESAQKIKRWFERKGFKGYVATEVQTLPELNQNLIEELKTSDYYLFLNFKRERIKAKGKPHRGSVYTQQELAVAYSLGFDDMLVLNQIGTKKEGAHEFLLSNAEEFSSHKDVLEKVKAAVKKHTWNKNHSRHLLALEAGVTSQPVQFTDHLGTRLAWVAYAVIKNARPDISASHCSARCLSVDPGGTSGNRGYLKVRGHIGHQQLIWPGECAEFDLLNILANSNAFPNQPSYPATIIPSDLDALSSPLFTTAGVFLVTYEVYAENFPRLQFQISVDVTQGAPRVSLVPK